MAKIIAIANQKGGVGKTTTTVSLGSALADEGRKVLLLDLDAQANLTESLSNQEHERTIYEAIIEGKNLPVVTVKQNLDIVPSSICLAGVELEIASRLQREYIIKDLIEPIESNYDYILLDCPPQLGLITLNAFVACHEVYITLTAEALPAKGLQMLTSTIATVQKRMNTSLAISGIIITRWKTCKLNSQVEEVLRSNFGEAVFNTKIRENIAIAEAPLTVTDVFTYAPKSNGAQDYRALAKEVLNRG